MAYNNSKGPRGFGDIKNEDDVDTQIDFESDSIGFKTNNITRFVIDNSSVSSSVDLETVGNSFLGGNLNLSGNFTIADKYIDISEMTAPGNPASDFGRLYVADDSGTTKLYFKDSAGTATNLLAGGLSQANQGNNRVVTSVDANNINAEANLTFDGNTLKAVGYVTSSLGVSSLSGSFEEGVAVGGSTIISADKDLTNVRSLTASTNIYAANGYFTGILDVEGNVVLGNAASDITTITGRLTASQGLSINVDDYPILLGAGADLSIKHDGNSKIKNTSGHIIIDNEATSKDIRFVLASDSADTEAVKIRNDSNDNVWACDAAGNVSGSGTLQAVGNTFLGAALNVSGNADFDGTITCDDSITIDSTTINAAEIGVLDSVTAGTAAASKAMVLDGSKDISGYRNLSGSGTLQVVGNTFVGGTLHVSGALSSSAALGGLSLTIGGAGNRGFDEDAGLSVNGINNNSAGISNAGSIAGATTISGSGAVSGFTGTFEGGLTVGGSVVITEDKVLQNVTTNFSALSASGGVSGLTLTVGGAGNRGFDEDAQLSVNAINANSQGISNAGAIAGATTISGSGNASAFTFTAEGGFKVGSTQVITEDKQLRARQIHVTRHHYENGSQDSFRWINFMNASETAVGAATYLNSMVAPFNGRLVRVIAKFEDTQNGNVTISIHTGSGLTVSNEPFVEDVTVTMGDGANLVGVFNTSGSQHYEAGSLIGVGVDPNNDPGRVVLSCIWEYDMTGL